jgi:RNA polymerase sigma-70 factor (ECF subfamily)
MTDCLAQHAPFGAITPEGTRNSKKACDLSTPRDSVEDTDHRALSPQNFRSHMNSAEAKSSNGTVELSDGELVIRSQSGDMGAFDQLVTRYRGKVYAMIVNMIHNEADAWDLAQDTFVKAWKALPRFEARSNFYTWLYRIAHNVTYDWLRKRRVRGDGTEFDDSIRIDTIESAAPTAPKPASRPDESAEKSELRNRIESAIAKLSPDHRDVILLKEIDGLKYQEIADRVGCSIGTVMSRLFYARKKLQTLLKDAHPTAT